MIRTIRPDVIVGFVFDGDGGGQHHQTSSRLTLEAFRAAADPAKFPEQIKEGLRPWQPKKFYYTHAGFGGRRVRQAGRGSAACRDLKRRRPLTFAGGAQFDPVLGRTYDEIAGEARSMHKCQGMSQLLPLPAPTRRRRIRPRSGRRPRVSSARHRARRRREPRPTGKSSTASTPACAAC